MNHTFSELEQLFSVPTFQSFFDAAPDAILIVNADGIIVHHNAMAKQMFGALDNSLENSLNGSNVDELVPAAARHQHKNLREGFLQRPTLRPMGIGLDLRAQRRDGSEFPVEISLSPLRIGATHLTVAIVRDITATLRFRDTQEELKRERIIASITQMALSEPRFEAFCQRMLETLHAKIPAAWATLAEIHEDGKRCKFLSAYPATSLLDSSWIPMHEGHIIHKVVKSGTAQVVSDMRSEGLPVHPLLSHLGIQSLAGAPIKHNNRVTLVLALGGKDIGAYSSKDLVFFQTLSNILANAFQRTKSEELVQKTRRLESIGRLTGGIAHDFNNLLTVISGNLQLIQLLVENNAAAQKSLSAALHASQRGADLTKKLLSFSRADALQARSCSTESLMHSCFELFDRTLGVNIRVSLELEPDLPMINVDPTMFESSLLNLAINARDAMPEGGSIFLRVTTKKIKPSSDNKLNAENYVVISVSDSGIGMSEETKTHLFEPFFTTKPSGQGTGLGLSTVYGFVKRANGNIEVESELGRGTTFYLYFPADETAARVGVVAADQISQAVKLEEIKHVMLIEDDPEVAEIAKQFMHSAGYDVHACYTHAQALEHYGHHPRIDLIVSDVVLKNGENGVTTVHALRDAGVLVPVVFVSGYSKNELIASSLSFPFFFLHKPYSKEQLLDAIAQAVVAHRG
jgi:PAS domain S-box-containing protein